METPGVLGMSIPSLDDIKERIRARQEAHRKAEPEIPPESSASAPEVDPDGSIGIDELNELDPQRVLKWLLSHQYTTTRAAVESGSRGTYRDKELLLKVVVAAKERLVERDPVESFAVEELTIKDIQQLREAMGIGTPKGDSPSEDSSSVDSS